MTKYIMTGCKKLSEIYDYEAKKIIVMPKEVYISDLPTENIELSNIPIGLNVENVVPVSYNFDNKKITNILCKEYGPFEMSFTKILIDYFYGIKDLNICILDFTSVFKECYGSNENYYFEAFDQAMGNINNFVLSNKDSDKKSIIIVIGAGQLKKQLSPNGIAIMNNLFSKIPVIDNSRLILIDSYDSIKPLQTETWYQGNSDNTSGIWLGQGIGSQVAININNLSVDHKKANFECMAFLVEKGQYSLIKYVIEENE